MSRSLPSTLVYVWCTKLCECCHMSAGEAESHSQVVEWISGSRIQSHCPCSTLWPISMFSRILETASAAVPASQAGGRTDTNSSVRPPTSRPRWTAMTRRMYRASSSPRLAITSSRIWSSSRPNSLMSTLVRCAVAVIDLLLQFDLDVAGRGRHAGLDEFSLLAVLLAGPQVAHPTRGKPGHAAVTDPHPASARHEDARVLPDDEQRCTRGGLGPPSAGDEVDQ